MKHYEKSADVLASGLALQLYDISSDRFVFRLMDGEEVKVRSRLMASYQREEIMLNGFTYKAYKIEDVRNAHLLNA